MAAACDAPAMRRLVLGVVLVAAVGGAWAVGVGPFDDVERTEGFPDVAVEGAAATEGPADGTIDASGMSGGDRIVQTRGDHGETGEAEIDFAIDMITSCGRTCRQVTVTLWNRGEAPATDVTVYSRLYVGNDTSRDDLIWSDSVSADRLPAETSVSRTRRVGITVKEGLAVRDAAGWMTGRTDVESAGGITTFVDRYDVTG